jgi:hypothetical protein
MVPDDPPASRPPGRRGESDPVEPVEETSPSTGRFQVAHRGGTRVEVGEAVLVGGPRPWMCAVKLLGRRREDPLDGDTSQTLLVRVGRGASADDARRDAMAQLTLVYGSPVEPAPEPVIVRKASDPPPPPAAAAGARTRSLRAWLGRLLARLRR